MPQPDAIPPGQRATTYIVAAIASLLISWSAQADTLRRPAPSTAAPVSPCDAAAEIAAQAFDVPLVILRALTRVETGRMQADHLTPWPWTLNVDGRGYWLETRQSALELLQSHLSNGRRSIDVGCFQLNYRWHGAAFTTIEEMLDPRSNALYAARFLVQLRSELGNWDAAVAAYHSRTPSYAERYLARYRQVRAALSDTPVRQARVDPPPSRPEGPRALSLASRPALLASAASRAQPLFSSGVGPISRQGQP